MNKTFISLIIALIPVSALAWSQKGHDVTAYIAEQHLTPATRAAIDSIYQGRSLVYWSNWLDNASHGVEYGYTRTWHYINVDAGKTYDTAPRLASGDAVTALRSSIKVLSDTASSREGKALALRILSHVMGDLHQPMHTGHASDLGGNKVKVKFFNNDTNLHSIWDSSLLETGHKWSYTEWQQQVDRATPAEQAVIISGNIDDWARQSLAIATEIYRTTPEGSEVSYDQIAHWAPTIETQLLKGGLRLAHTLNLIFDPNYRPGLATAADL